jgi:hypothetical protein
MALGNTSQKKRHGREIMGRRLPKLPGCSIGGETRAGRFSERVIYPGRHQIAISTTNSGSRSGRVHSPRSALEWNLLERDIRNGMRKRCRGDFHCTLLKRRRDHDNRSAERYCCNREGAGSHRRRLAGLHHRFRRHPISPVRFRQTGVVRTRERPEYAASGIIHK